MRTVASCLDSGTAKESYPHFLEMLACSRVAQHLGCGNYQDSHALHRNKVQHGLDNLWRRLGSTSDNDLPFGSKSPGRRLGVVGELVGHEGA